VQVKTMVLSEPDGRSNTIARNESNGKSNTIARNESINEKHIKKN
jgi:hypothetical protein